LARVLREASEKRAFLASGQSERRAIPVKAATAVCHPGALLARQDGIASDEQLASAICTLGDIDHDGFGEFAMGTLGSLNGLGEVVVANLGLQQAGQRS
jgi:hypothetical protein